MSKLHLFASTRELAGPTVGQDFLSVSISALANLMVDAYRDTVDWEDGDDETVAAKEIEAATSGHYGEFFPTASKVIVDASGTPISAILVTMFEDDPTILIVFTAKGHSRRGYAESLIRSAANELLSIGHQKLALFVSSDNPATNLYQRLGFRAKSSN